MFGHNIRSDLVALYIAETVAVFLAAYGLMAWGMAPAIDDGQIAVMAAALALAAGLVSGAAGLYQPSVMARARRAIRGGLVATALLMLGVWLAVQILAPRDPGFSSSGLQFALVLGAVGGTVLARLAHALASRRGFLGRRLLLVRDPTTGRVGGQVEPGEGRPLMTTEITLATPTSARLIALLNPAWLRTHNLWAMVAPEGTDDAALREHCRNAGLRLLTEDEFLECRLNRVACERLPQDWLARTGFARSGMAEAAFRRGFDILVALGLLVFAMPVMLGTAALILLEGKGPIFYRQERSGLHRRPFSLCKFRSMVVDAEAGGTPRWATAGDPRVTPLGRWLRLTRIDELPQLINVLRGDMSIVGPRPERPGFVEQLGDIIPRYHDRASVKPGITGWAQVNYPYGASVEDARMKLAYDLYYVGRRSLFLDLLILVATVRVVLFQEGAR